MTDKRRRNGEKLKQNYPLRFLVSSSYQSLSRHASKLSPLHFGSLFLFSSVFFRCLGRCPNMVKYEIFSALVLLLLPSTNPFIKKADIKSASNFKDLFGNRLRTVALLLFLGSFWLYLHCTQIRCCSCWIVAWFSDALSFNSGDKQNDASVNRHTHTKMTSIDSQSITIHITFVVNFEQQLQSFGENVLPKISFLSQLEKYTFR